MDTSSDCKTASELHKHVRSVREHLDKDWGVIVVAAGEAWKDRSLSQRDDPALVTPDCYGHQVHSLDYLCLL